jgi:hypothetical protein
MLRRHAAAAPEQIGFSPGASNEHGFAVVMVLEPHPPKRTAILSLDPGLDSCVATQANDGNGAASFKPLGWVAPSLLGEFGERQPPFGHFDEKRSMRGSTSFLRQPNAHGGVFV